LDAERRRGFVRGPLHGIPVIVKDNIATDDKMETTAGSLALVGSKVPSDAPLVRQLRAAGAVILGKANLSEWANFRGGNPDFPPINGWSARGGFTRNPYVLDLDPCGSSSGSAAAAAASLCAVAVGTETDGSILCPSGEQSLVGIKPTVGLVSGNGIIPIAHSQDTAGPMTRSVRDAALLLDAIRIPRNRLFGQRLPETYTDFLDRDGLVGARLAYDHRYVEGPFGPGDDSELAVIDGVLDTLRSAGAEIVDVTSTDPTEPDSTGRIPFDDEFVVLLFEFKVQIAEYLAPLRHTRMRTLSDLIAFNREHCDEELKWFGQEVFEAAEATSGDLADPEYLAAKATNQGFGKQVIDGFIDQGFDAVITPSFSFGTSPAATSGYPSMAVPVGYTPTGRPVGFWLAASLLQEPTLIRLGYAIEQLLQARVPPTLNGSVPPDPTPFPGCDATTATAAAAASASASRGEHMHPRHW
jgi:amidase